MIECLIVNENGQAKYIFNRVNKLQSWATRQSVIANWVSSDIGFGFTGMGVLIKSIEISSSRISWNNFSTIGSDHLNFFSLQCL